MNATGPAGPTANLLNPVTPIEHGPVRGCGGKTRTSGDPQTPPPFAPGHIIFDIPYQYKVGGGAFIPFSNVHQISELHSDPAQTLTSDKAGENGTTTVPAGTSNW
jgi:hypothetical protein